MGSCLRTGCRMWRLPHHDRETNRCISEDAPGCKWWLNCAVQCIPEWIHALWSRDYPKPVWNVTKAIIWAEVRGKLWRLISKAFGGVEETNGPRTRPCHQAPVPLDLSSWDAGALLTALGCCCCCCWSCLMTFLACSSSAPASSLCCLTVANSRLTR